MILHVFLDKEEAPLQTLAPPKKFTLNTEHLTDGRHTLRFQAVDDDGITSNREFNFLVQNGPAISVHGIIEGETISGEIDILANAFNSKIGDEFEPERMETPVPVPTWAWVLFLIIFSWGAGYISLELHDQLDQVVVAPTVSNSSDTDDSPTDIWVALGEQVYGNNCSSCHQSGGTGLPGVFPSLVGNSAVLDLNPEAHIQAIVDGLANKEIDGVMYNAPMPPFGSQLSNEEIAAVVNHERSSWGNEASLVTVDDIAQYREQ